MNEHGFTALLVVAPLFHRPDRSSTQNPRHRPRLRRPRPRPLLGTLNIRNLSIEFFLYCRTAILLIVEFVRVHESRWGAEDGFHVYIGRVLVGGEKRGKGDNGTHLRGFCLLFRGRRSRPCCHKR